MKIYPQFLLMSILILLRTANTGAQSIPAQHTTIYGKIMDSLSGKPVSYATINLLDTSNALHASAYSKENGEFWLDIKQEGSFIFEVSTVGYQLRQFKISLSVGSVKRNLGNLLLMPMARDLEEVIVTARRRLVEQKPGMLVYNAENDLANKGGTAADVLRKAPVLNVDAQGNVSMRGSSNLKILIDGKYSGQMARSPADALNMMPAAAIKSVEIITNPSAKYDAEGAAGVINIITKKGSKDFSGTLELSGSNYQQMINPRLSFGNSKWSFNFIGHLHRYRSKEFSDLTRRNIDSSSLVLNQKTIKDNAAPHASADISVVYTPDSLNEISLSLNSWAGRWPDNSDNQTQSGTENADIQDLYRQTTRSADNYLGSSLNLGYERKFSKPGQNLNLLLQMAPARKKSAYDLSQHDDLSELLYREMNNGFARNQEWTVQLDYIQPISKKGNHHIESGLKMIKRNVRNTYTVQASGMSRPEELELLPMRSDIFDYSQNVYAVYSMLKLNFADNWYAEGGARVEETSMKGRFAFNGHPFKNRFTNLIPTATLFKKITPRQSLSLSYSKRLTRPFVEDLNPNADASDPKNIYTGNPALNPEVSNQIELAHHIAHRNQFSLNTALFLKQTNNAMIDFTEVRSDGVSLTSRQNLAANNLYGLNISYYYSLNSSLSINGNVNPGYLHYRSSALQILNKGWAVDGNINFIWKMPKDYIMQVFGEYSSRREMLQGDESGTWFYNIAFKKGIPDKKLTITATLINPFSAYVGQQTRTVSGSFTSYVQNKFYSREFRLAVNWEFGNPFKAKEGKRAANDDVNDGSRK